MTKSIPVYGERVALVDDSDYEWLFEYPWGFQRVPKRSSRIGGYTYTTLKKEDDLGRIWTCRIAMHRLITEATKGVMVDHKNGKGLDNRRANLRLAPGNGNYQNKTGWGASEFKGVARSKNGKRWIAYCARQHLGTFDTATEAALAYDSAARKAFGDFAWLNFPDSQYCVP